MLIRSVLGEAEGDMVSTVATEKESPSWKRLSTALRRREITYAGARVVFKKVDLQISH
jgi:hypothetical protein